MRFKKTFVLFLVCFLSFGSLLYASSQFRIAVLGKNADVVLQGKPSATVGIDAFLQEGLIFLNRNRVVFNQNQNVTWRTFLEANGVRVRPGSDRYALRSDRYYQFSHITITAIKPRQPSLFSQLKKYQTEGFILGLGILVIFTLFYFKGFRKIRFKKKKKVKPKNTSRSIKMVKVSVKKKVKRKVRKKVQKKVKKKLKKITRKKSNKKTKKKSKKKPIKKSKKIVKNPVKKQTKLKRSSNSAAYQYDTSALKPKKYKSILIKPTAKRIKNIKLARQLALKSTENMTRKEKDLTLDDFIQEDLANNTDMLNAPTKTELRSQPGTESPLS